MPCCNLQQLVKSRSTKAKVILETSGSRLPQSDMISVRRCKSQNGRSVETRRLPLPSIRSQQSECDSCDCTQNDSEFRRPNVRVNLAMSSNASIVMVNVP